MGKCNFSDLWLEDSRFKDWLRPVVGNSREAYCHVCKKTMDNEYQLDGSVQGTGRLLVNIITGYRCQHFLCLLFMSSCHSARSPFICHDGTSFKAELHQRACNCCIRLSDVSVFLLYAFCCWIFSAAAKKGCRFNITGEWRI